MSFQRYVALGDSFTEGVGDPDPTADARIAERSQDALNHGVDVDADLWRLLRGRSHDFLVAESVLDAAHAEGEGGI